MTLEHVQQKEKVESGKKEMDIGISGRILRPMIGWAEKGEQEMDWKRDFKSSKELKL